MQRPGQGIGVVITATGVTPEMVRVDFRMADGSFFIANTSVTKSEHTNKQTSCHTSAKAEYLRAISFQPSVANDQ